MERGRKFTPRKERIPTEDQVEEFEGSAEGVKDKKSKKK